MASTDRRPGRPGGAWRSPAALSRRMPGRGPGGGHPAPRTTRRPATRPAPSARPKDLTTGPARTTRVRWLALAVIAVVLAITLTPTARSLMRQRAEIAALADKVSEQQREVATLQAESDRWSDPAYVEQQARQRLKFVKVGDRSYTVIDPAEEQRKLPAEATVAAPTAGSDAPWYERMWQSGRLADQPTAGLVPVADR
ncbi:MAG: FtsB family cell division protein [Dermatophilaceae bacterium]